MKKIAIIGTGEVGTALGEAFTKAGYEVIAVVSKEKKKAEKCMKLTKCKRWSNDPREVAGIADIILITVRDEEIEEVSSVIKDRIKNHTVVVHTSGALPSSILHAKRRLSLHPIFSFKGLPLKKGTYFGIEGEVEVGKKLVNSLGGKYLIIDPGLKFLYHAGLTFVSSYFLTLLNIGMTLLQQAKINTPEEVVFSLLTSVLENAKKFGIKEAITGPVKRGDIGIVRKEAEVLKNKSKTIASLYELLYTQLKTIINSTSCNSL